MTTIIWIRTLKKLSSRIVKTMRYLIFLLLAVSISLSAGTIHKWVDENGNVHYGDAPPSSVKTENVRVQSAPSNPGKKLPRLNLDGSGGQAAAGENGQQQQASGDQAKVNCENARSDLLVIEGNTRIRLQEADGSSRYLTPAEIQQRKALAQEDIKKYCR